MAELGKLPKGWKAWVAARPERVRELCKKYPPNRLYLLKSSGHRVFIYSYSEDGTVSVCVTGKFNFVTFERRVFGISPQDLEECDLPSTDEPLGVVLTEREDVELYLKGRKQ
jgi:hypothetical protein